MAAHDADQNKRVEFNWGGKKKEKTEKTENQAAAASVLTVGIKRWSSASV